MYLLSISKLNFISLKVVIRFISMFQTGIQVVQNPNTIALLSTCLSNQLPMMVNAEGQTKLWLSPSKTRIGKVTSGGNVFLMGHPYEKDRLNSLTYTGRTKLQPKFETSIPACSCTGVDMQIQLHFALTDP